MKQRSAWAALSVQELEEEITIRSILDYEMVGLLYPSIVRAEIGDLGVLIADKRRTGNE